MRKKIKPRYIPNHASDALSELNAFFYGEDRVDDLARELMHGNGSRALALRRPR